MPQSLFMTNAVERNNDFGIAPREIHVNGKTAVCGAESGKPRGFHRQWTLLLLVQ
jgi:hypothetical protein